MLPIAIGIKKIKADRTDFFKIKSAQSAKSARVKNFKQIKKMICTDQPKSVKSA